MAASTTVVSARVDTATAERAAACIKASGLTVAEVIKRLWETIATTGEVPAMRVQKERPDTLLDEFLEFQKKLPKADSWFVNLDDAKMNEMMADRYV